MSLPSSVLEQIIAPISRTTFESSHWEKYPLILKRSDPSYFHGLFSFQDLNSLLASNHLRYPGLRVFWRGGPVKPSEYLREWRYGRDTFDDLIDMEKVFRFIRVGATVNLLSLDRGVESLAELCRALEREIDFSVHCNGFYTPREAENIPPHYDVVDNFIVQISGSKRWRVWRTPYPLPYPGEGFNESEVRSSIAVDDLIFDETLEAGDTLFLPRGFVHEAVTLSEHSFHLVVAIHALRVYDVAAPAIADILVAMQNIDELRRGVILRNFETLHATGGDWEQLVALGRGAASSAVRPYKWLAAAERKLVRNVYTGRAGQFGAIEDASNVSSETWFFPRTRGLISWRVTPSGVQVILPGKVLNAPSHYAEAFNVIWQGEPFKAADLSSLGTASDQLAFVRRMVKEGLITIMDPTGGVPPEESHQ